MASHTGGYDVIVVGGGIEGSSSAYALAKEGKKVLLLEQFPLPHTRGSSGGHSRITRYAYNEDFYVKMMLDCFPMWDELAQESGTELFLQCGTIDLRQGGSASEARVTASLRQFNIPHEVLKAQELSAKFPMLRPSAPGTSAVWDPKGGLLKADKCLAAFQGQFKAMGGVIHDAEPVTSVQPGDQVTVVTSRNVYQAKALVIAAGPWTGRLAKSLDLDIPLQPVRINVLYWSPIEGKEEAHSYKNMPCLLDSRGDDRTFHIYALPEDEYPRLVKVCLHEGPEIDPDQRDRVDSQSVRDTVQGCIKELFPWLKHDKPTVEETCIYTVTPDNNPYIGKHPRHPNIVIAGGFSGHGFKLAPAVGKAISELVLGKKSSYNMEPFRLDRFSPKPKL